MSSAPSEESTRSDTERGIALPLQEGTPLDLALRDCGIVAVAIVGVALEVDIEPTVRHAADLGYIPVLVSDTIGSNVAYGVKVEETGAGNGAASPSGEVVSWAARVAQLSPSSWLP